MAMPLSTPLPTPPTPDACRPLAAAFAQYAMGHGSIDNVRAQVRSLINEARQGSSTMR